MACGWWFLTNRWALALKWLITVLGGLESGVSPLVGGAGF